MMNHKWLEIVPVTPENAEEETFFCIKDRLKPGFTCKQSWFDKRYEEGLRLNILKGNAGEMLGFIEYVPASKAWRPVEAPNFMFIHCMYLASKKNRQKGFGSELIKACEKDAKSKKMNGVCVMTSKGAWITDRRIFEKNGYSEVEKKGRFELLTKKWNKEAPDPQLIDWTANLDQYQGWHLIYADQCPWHDKSVYAIKQIAEQNDLDLKITKINSSEEAINAPSGYGVFNLLHDGKLLEDHYISATRFKNILKKELVGSK
ncbi:MAG: GNAT family N-acetyltransferase [Flavobacteriaceae bacterium]